MRIRYGGAAAQVLGKTQALRDSIPIAILEAKSHVVVRKVNLLENYDTKKEMHTLWGNVLDSESRALQRLASLQIDPNYLAFYTYQPGIRMCFDTAVRLIEADLRKGFDSVLAQIEQSRLSLPDSKKDYVPAKLYNEIVKPLNTMEVEHRKAIDTLLGPIEKRLIEVISRDNSRLTAESLQAEKVFCG
jgi:hypothetical protein